MTTLQKIKEILELNKVSYSFVETKTDTGVTVKSEGDFEIGKEAFVVAEDGTETPAPDGQHTLPELNIVIETQGGVVTSITPLSAEEEVPMAEENKLAITPEEQTAIVSEVMQILEPRFEEITRLFSELVKKIDEIEAKNNGEIEDLSSKVEKLSKEPGTKSKTTISEYNQEQKQTMEDKVAKFRRIVRNK